MTTPKITPLQALDYEVASSWWVGHVSIRWVQRLASRYFAWKVNWKYPIYSVVWDLAQKEAK